MTTPTKERLFPHSFPLIAVYAAAVLSHHDKRIGGIGFAHAEEVQEGSRWPAIEGFWFEDGFYPELLVQNDSTPTLNCSMIEEIWQRDADVFTGTEYVEIKDKCEKGVISTAEDVAAEEEQIQAPNQSVDEQISTMATNICDRISSGETHVDADLSEIDEACSAEPRDNESVIDAAIKIQAKLAQRDEEREAEMEETCISIAVNRDKIEGAVLTLAARSSERKLQDSGDASVPVDSYAMASDMLSMWDCLCDLSNPDNAGCLKKALRFVDEVAQSIEEQAATDFDPGQILEDVKKSLKKHTTHLRHSEYDSNDVKLSLERSLSEVNKSVLGKGCDPPGLSPTPHNNGMKLCLYAGEVFECEVNYSPHSVGCLNFECGAGGTVQLVGTVQLCYPGPTISLEIKMCVSVVSEVLEAIGTWIPAAESLFNKFSIYGGCYRLALASYDISNERFSVSVGPHRAYVLLNVFVKYGATSYMRFKGSGCAYYDDLSWYTYERTARTGSNLREVNLDYAASNDEWTYYSSKRKCPFQAGPWTYFQLYIGVELEWLFHTSNVWSMSKHFIDSTPLRLIDGECYKPGYEFFSELDSPGNDIGHWTLSISKLAEMCDVDSSCRGFNTNGWLKSDVLPFDEWATFNGPGCTGFYIKLQDEV